ncbi:MAG TPA: hypothetical protein VIT65_25475 [Microlunatus sp.]
MSPEVRDYRSAVRRAAEHRFQHGAVSCAHRPPVRCCAARAQEAQDLLVVLLVIVVLFVLGIAGCIALVGGAAKTLSETVEVSA